MKLLILLLVTNTAIACPEAIYYGAPCKEQLIDKLQPGDSIYLDYNDKRCTQPLLDNDICPDYLQGGCATKGTCETIYSLQNQSKKTGS
jgi:hypothetical protein